MWYTYFALAPLTGAAAIALDATGQDLYNRLYPSENELVLPTPTGWPGNLYEAMLPIYREPAWDAWLAPHRPIRGGRAWIYPTLLNP
jgi:hypothetical protein